MTSFTQAFEQEIANLEELFKERWEKILPIAELNEPDMAVLKDLKFKLELECGMARKFLKGQEYTHALVNFGLAERNYGVFFHVAKQLWQENKSTNTKLHGL
jgi:hypothetical protein